MISDSKIANAVSGKTARACDCCLKKRARWYCPADDAFLCQSCDGSVHSANPLARRHDRVRLKTVSLNQPPNPVQLPTWQRGSTRKTRTPRHGKSGNGPRPRPRPNPAHMVPELGAEETTSSQDEDQMLSYRVPISDTTSLGVVEEEESGAVRLQGMSDIDLEEFAADVETLLGKELDEEPVGIQQLGLLNEKDDNTAVDFSTPVKGEDDDEVEIREPFDFCFDNDDDDQDLPTTCEEEKVESIETAVGRGAGDWKMMMRLRLDYEAISEAWGSQASPWMNGQRPEINHQDCWPHCMGGTYGAEMCVPLVYVDEHQMGGTGGHGVVTMGDGGREARVLRYREKRRTRLFAKKIRYEVRKLNAEKRPRMKGRFVKRSSFASNVTPFPLRSK